MATAGEGSVSAEEFKLMADRAGLGMSAQELEDLKPLYELYLEYINQVHSVDFQASEIGVAFHPDWSLQ